MIRRPRLWLAVAVVFAAGNFVGGVMAAAAGEMLHATTHVVLMFLGAYAAMRLAPTIGGRRPRHVADDVTQGEAYTERLAHLAQAVDAVAIEVERIGEGQRYMTRAFTEKSAAQPDAETVKPKARPD